MATVQKKSVLRGERRVVLSGIPWELYEQLRENEDHWRVRMTYDQRYAGADERPGAVSRLRVGRG